MSQRKDTREVIKVILDEKASHFDSDHLSEKDKNTYKANAKALLENPVFVNELNAMIDGWAKQIAVESGDFGEVLDTRMRMLGLVELRDRISELAASPLKANPDFDPNAPV